MTRRIRRLLLAAALVAAAGLILEAQRPPASAGPPARAAVEDLVIANHVLARERIVDAFGHVSVRHDRDPDRYLLSRSRAPALVAPGDIVEYDLNSAPIDAAGRALYSERFIHGEIYRARPDVRAIVHAHAPALLPFGVTAVPLRPLFHMAGFIGEGLPVFDIREAAGMTDMLVRNAALGRALADSLADRPAVLLRGHGFVAVGPTLAAAVGRSIYLEVNARAQLDAIALGAPVTYLDPAEAQQIMEGEIRAYERAWEMWKAADAPAGSVRAP